MPEIEETLSVAIHRTYTLTYEHITKILEIAKWTGKNNQSEIVRDAIDLLHAAKAEERAEKQAATA